MWSRSGSLNGIFFVFVSYMPNAQYRSAVKTLMKSLTDYYGNADLSDTAAVSTIGKFMHSSGPVHTSTPTPNAGGDNNTDSNANSRFPPNLPYSILAELFLLIPEERLEQYPTERVQVTPPTPPPLQLSMVSAFYCCDKFSTTANATATATTKATYNFTTLHVCMIVFIASVCVTTLLYVILQ